MTCPKCGSDRVNVNTVTVQGKTKESRRGCLWTIGRWCLIICTLGIWLLVGKSKGKAKTKFETKTVAVCQNCGNTWDV